MKPFEQKTFVKKSIRRPIEIWSKSRKKLTWLRMTLFASLIASAIASRFGLAVIRVANIYNSTPGSKTRILVKVFNRVEPL